MNSKRLNCILLTLLLWNPLLLLLLTKSWGITIVTIVVLLVLAYFVSKSKSLRLKVWAFNLGLISSIALHAELLFRELLSDRNIPNLYELHGKYYFNKPYLNREFRTNEYVSTYKTNCQGYRMDDLSNADDTIKACDWLFIGDSFTQGAQVNYSELYTTRLYASFPNRVIVNGGISGAGLYDELNYFMDKGKRLSPKVVFLQIGVFNDFFNIKERKATHQDYLMEKSDLYRYLAYNVFSTDSLPLGRWTEPFFPTQGDNRDFNILYKNESEVKQADKAAFVQCIKDWKKETDQIGAQLVLMLIPSKEQVSPVLLKEVMDKYHITANQLDMNAPNRLFASTAAELNIKAIDITEEFQRSQDFPFFAHDEHLNTIGHQLIAQSLAKVLKLYADGTEYISHGNNHERYPMYYPSDSILLYQGQNADQFFILNRSIKGGVAQSMVSSFEELVHPALSPDMRYLVYTEGNQESSETDVILLDNILGQFKRINGVNQCAAIPMFSHSGRLLAMPLWSNEQKTVANIHIYDLIQERFVRHIASRRECWRPVFSLDDKSIFFIKKENFFAIKQFSFASELETNILSLPFDIWDIALSPSGKYLVFAGNKDGNWDLFSYAFATREVKQLTHTLGDEWDPAFGATDNDLWFAGTFGFNDGIFYRRINL